MSIDRGSTVLIFRNLLNGMARASLFYLHVNDTKCPRALIRVKHCETYFICYLFLPLHLSCMCLFTRYSQSFSHHNAPWTLRLSSFSTDILGYDQVWYVMVNDIKECILSANTNCTSLFSITVVLNNKCITVPKAEYYHIVIYKLSN